MAVLVIRVGNKTSPFIVGNRLWHIKLGFRINDERNLGWRLLDRTVSNREECTLTVCWEFAKILYEFSEGEIRNVYRFIVSVAGM